MHIHLRERNTDSFLIECLFHVFLHIEKRGPVVLAFAKRTGGKVHGTVTQFRYDDTLGGGVQNPGSFFSDFQNNLAGLIDAIAVPNSKC